MFENTMFLLSQFELSLSTERSVNVCARNHTTQPHTHTNVCEAMNDCQKRHETQQIKTHPYNRSPFPRAVCINCVACCAKAHENNTNSIFTGKILLYYIRFFFICVSYFFYFVPFFNNIHTEIHF